MDPTLLMGWRHTKEKTDRKKERETVFLYPQPVKKASFFASAGGDPPRRRLAWRASATRKFGIRRAAGKKDKPKIMKCLKLNVASSY
jgi:hypothetical protein